MARPFDHVLRLPGAQPEDVALAIAAEFEQVDPAAAHERLDRFAAGLGSIGRLPAAERAVALVEELAIHRGLATLDPRARAGHAPPLAGPLRARIDIRLAGVRAQLN